LTVNTPLALTLPLDGVRLIEASAGTGKTYSIRGLYLRHVLERQVPVEKLLVVTFTNAATAELAERIRASLVAARRVCEGGDGTDSLERRLLEHARAAGVGDEQIRLRLEEAIAFFDEAAIFTIHGFCQRALAEAPFTAGLPYRFELGDDDAGLRLEVARDFWRREFSGEAAPGETLLADYLLACGDSPERWAGWLGEVLARPLAREEWEDGSTSADDPVARAAALDAAWAETCGHWGDGTAILAAIEDVKAALDARSYKDFAIALAHRQWKQWITAGEVRAAPPGGDKLRLFTTGKLKVTKARARDGFVAPAHPFFAAAEVLLDARDALDDALESARLCLLRRFIAWGRDTLRQRKWDGRGISFDDLLWLAFQALHDSRLAAELRERYPVALIDEFQDTDPVQWAIFSRIYLDGEHRGVSLFLVGDPKQAIYSFRGADLHTYFAARARVDGSYALDTNHRSVPVLVAACNHLFGANRRVFMDADLLHARVAGVETENVLVDGTASGRSGAALRLWRIPASGAEGGDERLMRAEVRPWAARTSAAEIARLLNAGARMEIRIGARGVEPSDIAVLVRSHREGAMMREALAGMGVGSVELAQESVYASREAEELERILRAVDEAASARHVKTALATELMGWDAVALERLAWDDELLFIELERFAAWRALWRRHGFIVMLRRWMEDDGVAARLLALGDGERRLTNLLHLAELLQQEAGKSSSAVLLTVLARHRRARDGGEAAQLRLESDRNLVRIVTIHKSKGLEYGIVFCPFLFDGRVRAESGGALRFWHDAGGGQVIGWRKRGAGNQRDCIDACWDAERDAETMRLIYVALTRAIYRCYLVVGAYRQNTGYNESGRSPLNWMVAGDGIDPLAWKKTEWTALQIDASWAALADGSKGAIVLDDLPAGGGERYVGHGRQRIFSAATPREPAEGWWLGSFSALTAGAEREEAARDHDARGADAGAAVAGSGADDTAVPLESDDIVHFPRGAVAGDCIHGVFEKTDFTRPDSRAPAIAAALAAHFPSAAADGGRLANMLARMLEDVFATVLPCGGAGLKLATLAAERSLTELEFYLPAPRLSADVLNRWLVARGYAVPRLTFGTLEGYLKGYIDLVFEHEERFWVLDWKSNHLGVAPQAYGPAALEAEMVRHGYHLQHLLYSVALHRHLGQTLAGYDYEHHFGGVLYLFVRGVRPGWGNAGVFHHRPARETIESLDCLLRAV
jgi:exodeoxyribonuclease V beta subunit